MLFYNKSPNRLKHHDRHSGENNLLSEVLQFIGFHCLCGMVEAITVCYPRKLLSTLVSKIYFLWGKYFFSCISSSFCFQGLNFLSFFTKPHFLKMAQFLKGWESQLLTLFDISIENNPFIARFSFSAYFSPFFLSY